MKCPYCFKDDNIVLETRERNKFMHRRRYCRSCGQKFNTKEIISRKDLGDYPGVIENQFDNMTGSMNL